VLVASVVEERDGRKEFYSMVMTGAMQGTAFVPDHRSRLDFGPDFYAPQTFLDDKDRRIVIAWMENWGNQFVTHTRGWSGALTLPRELSLDDDGRLIQRPVEEAASLRKNPAPLIELTGVAMNTTIMPLCDSLELFEILLEYTPLDDDARCGIVIANREGEELTVCHDAGKSSAVIDRTMLAVGERGVYEAAVSRSADGRVDLHIFCDRSSVEIFACGGAAAITARTYFNDPLRRVDVFSRGRVLITRCALWELTAAW
jgi:beta-fructofuranosidase